MCGLAELILPPASFVESRASEQHPHHAPGSGTTPHPPVLSPGEGEGGEGQQEEEETPPPGRAVPSTEGSGPGEESESEKEAQRPKPIAGLGTGPQQLPAVVRPSEHFAVHISVGSISTLQRILTDAFRSTQGSEDEAREVLAALQALKPEFVENVPDPMTEPTAQLDLGSENVEYAFEDGVTPQSFVANLSSYARSQGEASEWIEDAVATWARLIQLGAPRVRRSAAPRATPRNDENGERIFVYCDVIQCSPCSDTKTRCLRIISVSRQNRHFLLFPVYYFACSQRVVQYLHIEMKDKRGDLINFAPSQHPSVIILHFRRVY